MKGEKTKKTWKNKLKLSFTAQDIMYVHSSTSEVYADQT